MAKQILGLSEVNGSLVVYRNVEDVSNEEMVQIALSDGSIRNGRVVQIEGDTRWKIGWEAFFGWHFF